jgi:N-acylneuraminate cytidylyltransferase
MRKVAIIPVKHISERVKNKNFKEFISGISLFELKLKQLLNKDCFDQIYISTNSPIVEKILKSSSYKMVKILKRDDVFCTNDVSWSDVIHNVISSIPEEDNTCVSWCHTTSPMFNQYEECLEVFLKNYSENKFNGLVTVANFNEFLIDEKTNPVNYSWGPWHKYSQYLTRYYTINGALFIATKDEMIKNRYVISSNPYLYVTSKESSIDVDDELDFKFAQFLFAQKNHAKN